MPAYFHLYACFVVSVEDSSAWRVFVCDTDALQRLGLDVHQHTSAIAFDGSLLPDWAMIEADRGDGMVTFADALCHILRPAHPGSWRANKHEGRQ